VSHRRRFIRALAAATLTRPLGVLAQRTGKIARLGYLRLGESPLPQAFVDRMRELGWVEGRNLRIEPRYVRDSAELKGYTAELVAMKVDVILSDSTPVTRAAIDATNTIPIVFSIGGDPVANGLVATMSRPGGNATGYTFGLYEEKLVETLKSALPRLKRVGFPGNDLPRVEHAAHRLGMEIVKLDVPALAEVATLFDRARERRAEAVIIPNAPTLNPLYVQVATAALAARMPAISWDPPFARAGGLLAFGPSGGEGWIRMASQIDRILKGAKPAELPVEQPVKFRLVINLATAKVLGVTIPSPLRLRADEVVV